MVSPKEISSTPNSNSLKAKLKTLSLGIFPSYGHHKEVEMYPLTKSPISLAFLTTGFNISNDPSMSVFMFFLLNVSEAAVRTDILSILTFIALSNPLSFGTMAEYITPSFLFIFWKTSSASASCGTHLGCTKEVTSISSTPVSESKFTNSTFLSVSMISFMF